MPARTVPANEARRPFTRREFIQKRLEALGRFGPHGHGFPKDDLVAGRAYYRFDVGDGIVGIMQDTTNPGSDRMASRAFLAMLRRFPNVILWVNGHSRINRDWSHPDPTGTTSGLWEINTAAHIDYPRQSRAIDIVANGDGMLSIFGILIDHSDPMVIDAREDYTRAELASLSLELAANDPHLDRALRLGAPEDQNVELVIRAPFAI